eukprot:4772820-Pyramimonas_sp.AAC.1
MLATLTDYCTLVSTLSVEPRETLGPRCRLQNNEKPPHDRAHFEVTYGAGREVTSLRVRSD